MNSFNSMKNGSSVVNPRTLFKIIQVFNDIYVLGSYSDVLKMYNTNDTEFSSSMTFTTGYTGIFIAKYNNSGMVTWISRISGVNIGTSYPVNMVLDSDNNIYILGSYIQELRLYDSDGNQSIPSLMNTVGNNIFLAKYNSDGIGIWVTQISMNIIPSLTNVAEFTLTNIGGFWTEITATVGKSWYSISLSSDGQYQTSIVYNSTIHTSSDYGTNWIERTSPGSKLWWSVSVSSTGQYQTAVVNGGNIHTSSNYGVNWTEITSITNKDWNAVSLSSDGMYQTAVVYGGKIHTSFNYGASWTEITSVTNKDWYSISLSSTGQYQTAVVGGGFNSYISTSSNYGANWSAITAAGSKQWYSVSISSSGQYQTAVVNGGKIHTSSNYGANWTEITSMTNKSWKSVSITSTGMYQIAVAAYSPVNISSDYGVNWVEKTSSGNKSWMSVSISSTGVYQTAAADGATGSINTSVATTNSTSYTIQPVNLSLDSMNNIYISGKYATDITLYNSTYNANSNFVTLSNVFGNHIFVAKYNRDGSGLWAIKNNIVENTWILKDQNRQWNGIAMSSDGQYQTAVVLGGRIYVSNDFGNNWTAKMTDVSRAWYGVAMSSTGQYQTATDTYAGYIYVSTDTGNTWTAKDSTRNWKKVAMSSTGQYQTAIVEYQQIYLSTDTGNTWTAKDTNRDWKDIAMSSTGQYQTAPVGGGLIYVSTDSGNTWIGKDITRSWLGVAMSSTGQYQTATIANGPIYVSSDTGNTWFAKTTGVNTSIVAMSSTGQYQTVVQYYSHFISIDYGNTWESYSVPTQRHGFAMSSTGQHQTTLVKGNKIHILSRTLNSNNLLLSLDTSNNVYISGNYNTSIKFYSKENSIFQQLTGTYDIFVAKYNSDGSGLWTIRFESPGVEPPIKLIFDSVNNIYISGTYYGTYLNLYNSTYVANPSFKGLTNAVNSNIFIAKYTSDGSGLWATRISDASNNQPVNLVLDSLNNVYISGTYTKPLVLYNSRDTGTVSTFTSLTNTGMMNISTFVAKYNSSDGSGLWATQLGTENIIDVSTFGTTLVEVTATVNKQWSSVSLSSDGKYQTAVINNTTNGTVFTSSDYGVTWVERTATGNKEWSSVSISSDGKYQTAVINSSVNGRIHTSSNYGVTWVERTATGNKVWRSVSLSSTGIYQTAVTDTTSNGTIFTSSDYGVNWVERTATGNKYWRSVSLSSTGQYQTAVNGTVTSAQGTTGGIIHTSSNYGVTWVERTATGNKEWSSVSLSSTGQYQTAVIYNIFDNNIHTSSNYGVNWVGITATGGKTWTSVSLSSTGMYQTAVNTGSSRSYIHISSDYGVNWVQRTGTSKYWTSVSLSSDGMYLTAVFSSSSNVGSIYTSKNNIMIMSIVNPINLSVDSGNNVYISGTQNTPFALYNSTDTITPTFKTLTNTGNIDTFIAKYNSDGSGVWATRIGDSSFNNPVNLVLDLANDVYISGTYGSQLTLYNSKDTGISTTFKTLENSGGANTFITKYNKYGTGIWATRIAGTNSSSNYINNLMLSK